VTIAAVALESRPVESLIPYARNARLHDDAHIAQLAASLREWGWTFPVLIDETDGIIAGHGRVLAARKLEMTEVPVIVARGWTEEKKRAYILADNKLALNAKWDNAMLASELAELRDVFALDLAGFSEDELKKLLVGVSSPDEFQEFNDTLATEHACPKCGYRF
jgi:ParB-like chromosome segregation protein Spo0J